MSESALKNALLPSTRPSGPPKSTVSTRNFISALPSESTLFHSKPDRLIKNPRKWFATALEQAEIEGVTWHTLRHTFASRLVMVGVDLKTVQKLVGRKTVAMIAHYAHLAPMHKLQTLETLVYPGSVSVPTGRKMATTAKADREAEN